ncbi:DUF4055 domain-containing protein [Alcaligenes faecalis]|uniref:DUF4055 domain-containing protein n=1 Tax=Alcaligenes faecalis TaxID=511 RepID=UPI0005A5E4D5|nr:DUF4055 domain-containing protein [Alcaligenes faecalis]MCX5593055.1 DUF4055 domain-containing protein [Alcaligenes faecalis]QQC31881.1 DUF4055 domain-containing protein [Alcaligenes faecalis]CAJ0903244.1 DUF4055 domain-containing protein [Alcaligenes faecalis subsp. faecalis]CUI53160.1 Uncharacterised protein [Alcaligenes faecalis]GAU72429.1 DNA-binding protein [Alcaligenes faecalis subsp. faecalis NBRC 13111]
MSQNPNQVDYISPTVSAMAEKWPAVDALRGGTDAMREAEEKYLRKRTLESREDYKARLAQATLYPAFTDSVAAMVGRVFTKPIKIGEKVPQEITDLLQDVDTEDRNLHAFARDWMDDAVSYGISHVLVDMPKNDAKTQAEEKQLGIRPYAVLVKHDQILGWRSEKHGGNEVLTQVRIKESAQVEDGAYGEKTVERIRVLEIGRYELHQKNEGGWALIEEGKTTLDRIPLVTLYANRTGFMIAVPPLLELAHLNIKFWQKQSSLDSLIDTACVPILATFGLQPKFDADGKEVPGVIFGAKTGVDLPVDGDIKYVEHTGAAIESGRQDLLDLKDEMRIAGGQLLRPDASVMTAAQAETENAKEISRLGMIAQNLEDSLDQVLYLFALWMKKDWQPGNVEVHANLDPDYAPAESMNVLISMYNAGALSKQGLFNEAKRRGMISDDVTWEDEQQRIDEAGPDSGEIARVLAQFRKQDGGEDE